MIRIKLNFYAWYVWHVLLENIGTFLLLIGGISILYCAINIDDDVVKYKVIKSEKIGNEYFNIINRDGNHIVDSELKISDKPLKMSNGYYNVTETNVLAFVLYIFSIASLVISCVINIVNMLDDNFIPYAIHREILYKHLRSEYEDGIYYYFIYNRLVGKRSDITTNRNISYEFNIDYLRDVLTCPIYKTKGQKRESKLNKLLK